MGGTLLLADDSITIQKVVELTFAETEHNVVAVGSGRDLFKRLPDVKPDVVLCDVVMPDVNGYEVCQTLKSDPATLHIPVVLLTGTFEPFDRDRALAAGCDAIVTKPFEARELIDVVEDLIRRTQAIPPPIQAGELDEHGIPEGVPALDFSTTGFDQMVAPRAQPTTLPEDGIDLTASSLGDSNPQGARPAPPELQDAPPPPQAQETLPAPAFAFGGEQGEPFGEPVVLTASPGEELRPEGGAPEPAGEAVYPAVQAETGEPFPAAEPSVELHEEEEQSAAPVSESFESAAVFTAEELDSIPSSGQAIEDAPTQRFLVQPHAVPSAGSGSSPTPEGGVLSDDELERIAARAAELVPPAPAPPTASDLVTDELVQRVAARAVELMPAPPAPPTAADLLTDEHVERIASRAVALAPPPPTASQLLTDEHVERIAARAAELVPPPAAAPAEPQLSDDQIEHIARRVVELAAPSLERIAWEVIPDMAEMAVRKRISELEAAADDDN
jgi:CheY-like chemotaxis protein